MECHSTTGKCLRAAFVQPKVTRPFPKCNSWIEEHRRTCLHPWQTEMMSVSVLWYSPAYGNSRTEQQEPAQQALEHQRCNGYQSAQYWFAGTQELFGKNRIASEELSFTCNLFCGTKELSQHLCVLYKIVYTSNVRIKFLIEKFNSEA